MSDATLTAESNAAETPSGGEVENEALQTQTEEGQQDGSEQAAEGEEGEQQSEPELTTEEIEELELEGQKYRIPKAVKPLLMMQADYTRKTQELAEQRRAIDSERETFTKLAKEHVAEVGRLTVLDEQIGQYAKVDWNKLQTEDPLSAQQHWMAYQQLKDQRGDLSAKIQQQEQRRSQEAERNFANRYAETTQALAREIPGWNETAPKVAEFLRGSEVSESDLRLIATNPKLSKLCHAAWLGTQVVAKQQQAAAKAKQPVNQIKPKPLTQVGKGGTGAPPKTGLSDDLPVEEWAKRRNEQLRKR